MLNFKRNLAAFAVGRRVNGEEWNAFTGNYTAADNVVRLGFGRPVMPGDGRDGVLPLSATNGTVFLGVTEADATLPRVGDGFAQYDEVPVLEWGVLGVEIEGNVTRGQVARWNTVSNKWTAAAQSATVVTIPGIAFDETAVAPLVGPIRIRKTANPALTVSG